jgi:hypothetical protein
LQIENCQFAPGACPGLPTSATALKERFVMKTIGLGIRIYAATSIFLIGCGQGPNQNATMFKHPPDTDVTSFANYNFSKFAGTVWKMKVKLALADCKLYTGKHVQFLFAPKHFDSTHPEYTPLNEIQIIAVIPPGTRLRIERLMKDNGNWSGVRVEAVLEDVTYSEKTVFLDDIVLAKNRFIAPGWTDSKEWGVDPDMLEKAE